MMARSTRSSPSSSTDRNSYQRPWLADYQIEALFGSERYGIVEGSTKCGKTAPCLIWLAEQAMLGKRGQNFWWVAPVYTQAEIAYTRMKRGLPSHLLKTHDTGLWIELSNGARMWFRSAEKPDNLYGEDVYAAVIDEASRCREESWYAVRSTMTATRGKLRVIGNVKGRKNWAYAMARRAEAGEPGMTYKRITAYDAIQAGILKEEEIAQAKADLPDHVFRELYLAEPTDDGGNPFGLSAIAACVVPTLSAGKPVVWGWDLAKSKDWTVGIALDASGQVCRFERFQTPWEITTTRIVEMTGGTPALVDSTGVGDPIVERLQKHSARFEGYQFTMPSKQKLMEGLAVAIQRREVGFPDGPIRVELENFEYVSTRTGVRYSAPEGQHDDCVCALALAVMHKGHAKLPLSIDPELKALAKMPRRSGSPFSFRL